MEHTTPETAPRDDAPFEVPREEVGTRLLFENERIRVWDLALLPGESLPAHVHRLPFCFIVSRGGDLQHADPNHAETARAVSYDDNQVVFRDPTTTEPDGEAVHLRLTNVGTAPYQNYVIEFKD
jgi:hypothetical protein